MKLLLYCTKQPLYLVRNECDGYFYTMDKGTLNDYKNVETYNGKIVSECDFEVEEIEHTYLSSFHPQYCIRYSTNTLNEEELSRKSCLKQYSCNEDEETLCNYLGENNGYAIHIKNLHIFDKPRELSEYGIEISPIFMKPLENAPQNMMRCIDAYDNQYILISIRPEWLSKILNGEKTIVVRKKVLKEMIS